MNNLAHIIANMVSIRNDKGVTAIEYGMLAALISLAIIGAVTLLGGNLATVFSSIAGQVAAPAN